MASEKITVSRKSNDFGKKLLSLQQRNKFCDATLIVNEERIAVHKNVLAASSIYFENIFLELELNELTLKDVDKEALQNLINFCYVGTIEIDESMLKEAIETANALLIYSFVESYAEILEKRLSIENSISTLKISKSGHMEKLKQTVFEFIKNNFEKVSKLPVFPTLNYSDMHELLSSDMNLHPMIIYEALKRWFDFDIDSRLMNINYLLAYVPLSCLPHDFLISESSSLCNSNNSCAEKFLAALKKQENDQFLNCNMDTLIAVGQNIFNATKMEIYDNVDKKWIVIEEMDYNHTNFTTFLSNDKFILVGGYNNKNIVSSYDIKTGTISALPSLLHGRHRPSVVQVEDKIYAISGHATNSVERYDPILKSWSDIESMKTPRTDCQAAVIDDKIYAMGGISDNNEILDTTECYDQFTNSWEYRKSMNEKRSRFSVTVIGKFIYAVGGRNSSGNLKSAERYDATIDQWTMITSSNFDRFYSAAGNLNGQLVVAGGYTGVSGNKVEIYDESNEKWNSMASLNIPRYGFKLINVSKDLAQDLLSRKA